MRYWTKEEIKSYWKTISPQKRKAILRQELTWKGWRYPYKLEKNLEGRISHAFSAYISKVYNFVDTRYPKTDSFDTDFRFFLERLVSAIEGGTYDLGVSFDLRPVFREIAEWIVAHNITEFENYMKRLTGKAFHGSDEWWDMMKQEWVDSMQERFSTSVKDYNTAITNAIFDAVRNDLPYEEVMANIMKLNSSFTITRASFVAKDGIGKLNGQIQKSIQTGMGINEYRWMTKQDDRVRGNPFGKYPRKIPDHWAMDSLICSWIDPTIYTSDYGRTWVLRTAAMPKLHPGEDWQCRCTAVPFSLSMLREVDNEVRLEGARGVYGKARR